MKTSEEIAAELDKPLDARHVATRQAFGSSGAKLSYIESHHAIREANRIFGFGGWDRQTVTISLVQSEQKPRQNGGDLWWVGYTAKVAIFVTFPEGIVRREGTGFGQGQDADLGKAHESAIKEAESDAMKRALMTFGDPFGLALYDKAQEHVEKPSQAARSARPERETVPADRWTAAELGELMRQYGVKGGMFAPVLKVDPKELNNARLMLEVGIWMNADSKRKLEDLVREAAVKGIAPLPDPSPEDLSPRSDVRQAVPA